MNESNLPPFQTIRETARTFRVSRSTLYVLAAAGKLPIRKVGGRSLIATSDMLALIGLIDASASKAPAP
jgi:excisionase family DNA binding protein